MLSDCDIIHLITKDKSMTYVIIAINYHPQKDDPNRLHLIVKGT